MKQIRSKQKYIVFIAVVLMIVWYLFISGEGKEEEQLIHYVPPKPARVTIPPDDELHTMSLLELQDLYHRYVNTAQIGCGNIVRVGKLTDGGWDICDDEANRLREKCLVYSFGINYDFSFDDGMATHFGCMVHSFDPSMGKKDYMRSVNIAFHAIGLSNSNKPYKFQTSWIFGDEIWKMRTFSQIRKEMNHAERVIDILKMDIEAFEWRSLTEMLEKGSLNKVRQLAVEFHVHEDAKNFRVAQITEYLPRLKIIRSLYDIGYRIFFTNENMNCVMRTEGGKLTNYTGCQEVSFIQTLHV